jgi:plastocyanin
MTTLTEDELAPSRRTGGNIGDDGGAGGRPGRSAAPTVGVAVAVAVALTGLATWSVASGRGSPDRLMVATADFAFSPLELRAGPGPIEVTLTNTDAVTHTFTIPSLGVDLVVASGEADTSTFEARPGRYRFICTVPGHDVPGMRGVLTVG